MKKIYHLFGHLDEVDFNYKDMECYKKLMFLTNEEYDKWDFESKELQKNPKKGIQLFDEVLLMNLNLKAEQPISSRELGEASFDADTDLCEEASKIICNCIQRGNENDIRR